MLNHLVPSEKLEETTRDLCEKIIARPPLVQWISKRIMRAALDSTLETDHGADLERRRHPATFRGRKGGAEGVRREAAAAVQGDVEPFRSMGSAAPACFNVMARLPRQPTVRAMVQ